MSRRRKKNKIVRLFGFAVVYALGLLTWVGGFHCLEMGPEGELRVSGRKLSKHLFKLFLWTVEIALVYRLMGIYRSWLLQAPSNEIVMAFLLKSVIFLYIKVFWPRVFPEILPGLHVFLCPQCYRKQTFRFLPISFSYGFFVTYLCRYCSCLVNGWGEQIFYPNQPPGSKIYPPILRMMAPIIFTLFIGFFTALKIFEYF